MLYQTRTRFVSYPLSWYISVENHPPPLSELFSLEVGGTLRAGSSADVTYIHVVEFLAGVEDCLLVFGLVIIIHTDSYGLSLGNKTSAFSVDLHTLLNSIQLKKKKYILSILSLLPILLNGLPKPEACWSGRSWFSQWVLSMTMTNLNPGFFNLLSQGFYIPIVLSYITTFTPSLHLLPNH